MISPTLLDQIAKLEAAIAAQEALRPTLGDRLVDAALGAIRTQLDVLHAQVTDRSLERELVALQRADLIRRLSTQPEPDYMFKHALTQDAAYSSLLLAERKALHAAIARVLGSSTTQRTGAEASLIAEHYLRAEAWAEAVAHLLEAGDAAARSFAHPEARLHYARALDALAHLPQSERNDRLKVDTILNLVNVSLRALGPAETLAWLRDAEGLIQGLSDQPTTAEDRLRLARIYLWTGHALNHANRGPEAMAYMRQVLAMAQDLGDEDLLAVPANIIGRVITAQGRFPQAEALLRQASGPLAKVGNWPEWILCQVSLAFALAGQGHVADALGHAERGLTRARELDYATGTAHCHMAFADVYGTCRDGAGMRRHAQAGLDVARAAGDRLLICVCGIYLAWAQSRLGEHARATITWAEAEQIGLQIGGSLVDRFAAARAELALAAGQLAEARTLAERAVVRGREVDNILAQGMGHCTWAQALVALDPGKTFEADAHLAESLRLLEEGHARLEAASTHVAWGELCRARGDREAAREHFEFAAAQFEASGLFAELERTRQLIAELT